MPLMCLKDPYKIMYRLLSLPFLSRPVHHPYFSLLSSALLVFEFQNVLSLVMPGAFCKEFTVFTIFRVFCASCYSSICIVNICSVCRCNEFSNSSVCIPRFFCIFLLFFRNSAIFVLFTFTSSPLIFYLHFYYFI